MNGDGDVIARLQAELAAARAELAARQAARGLASEAEQALRRSEENFENFVRAMPVPAVIHRDTTFVLVNQAFTSVFGYTEAELLGERVFRIVTPEDRPYVEQWMARPTAERGGGRTREHHLLHSDGTPIPVEVTTVPVFFRGRLSPMGVIHDLRERKHLEAQLITADRMATLGRLSAAVGHEINNPLAYILGSLSLIDREIAQLATEPLRLRQLRDLIANVREGAERIRAVVQDLKALSREHVDLETPVDLAHVLDLCTAMADHEVRHRARLVKDYGSLPPVRGTEARLGQVFLNLLVNAAQATPEGDVASNEIRIEARTADGTVTVDVIDTGRGVDPELVSRIFEPFVTTKTGSGTGLGLSICQHIVASLGGTISVSPNTPRGARFHVVLPRADGGDTPIPPADASANGAACGKGLEARVLVVDDEPQLATMIARLLRPRAVDVAHGGKEAIARLGAGQRYDVILCDLHMTDLSGMDVYEHVRRTCEGLERRMIFMTGGVMSERAIDFVTHSGCPVLDKPFDARTLESAITAVLERSRSD